MDKIKEFWEKLPAELKVSAYIAFSYGLSEAIIKLSDSHTSNIYLAISINILLVFLKELKPRIDRLSK